MIHLKAFTTSNLSFAFAPKRHTVMLQLLFDLTDAGKNESFIRTTRYKENDSPQIFPSPSLRMAYRHAQIII